MPIWSLEVPFNIPRPIYPRSYSKWLDIQQRIFHEFLQILDLRNWPQIWRKLLYSYVICRRNEFFITAVCELRLLLPCRTLYRLIWAGPDLLSILLNLNVNASTMTNTSVGRGNIMCQNVFCRVSIIFKLKLYWYSVFQSV